MVLLFACICAVQTNAQEKPLDNAEIIKLTKLDMGDEIIIAKIKSAKDLKPGEYGLFSGQTALFGGLMGSGEGQAILFDFGVDK